VCVQARLRYFNHTTNLLTRMLALEYGYWFGIMLPGLDRLRLPIPLGGTSNHFRAEALRRLGGWDPHNVTEDADLGLRATVEGCRVGEIDSATDEEACSRVRPWIRQRTRWIKGYMQTALVHLVTGPPVATLLPPCPWRVLRCWRAHRSAEPGSLMRSFTRRWLVGRNSSPVDVFRDRHASSA
jgi:cellulose synthase/poly-beta-1,6-N-acetylglucosamine synthase-like glycosyltransferase